MGHQIEVYLGAPDRTPAPFSPEGIRGGFPNKVGERLRPAAFAQLKLQHALTNGITNDTIFVKAYCKLLRLPKNIAFAFSRFRRLPFLPGRRFNLQYDLTTRIIQHILSAQPRCNFLRLPETRVFAFSRLRRLSLPPGRRLNPQYDLTHGILKYHTFAKCLCGFCINSDLNRIVNLYLDYYLKSYVKSITRIST